MKSILLLLVLLPLLLPAQDKVEAERRIKARDVPKPAREWLRDAFEGSRKVRWYKEETSGAKSFEAKFAYQSAFYSVEFDTLGVIEDIEVDREWDDLPAAHRSAIQQQLDVWDKVKLRRIQEQWTGEPDDLEDAIDEDEWEGITTRYEVEMVAEIAGENALWEVLFSIEGEVLLRRRMILRADDNLNF